MPSTIASSTNQRPAIDYRYHARGLTTFVINLDKVESVTDARYLVIHARLDCSQNTTGIDTGLPVRLDKPMLKSAREAEFNRIADEWEEYVGGLSSVRQKMESPLFARLKAMGASAIRPSLDRMFSSSANWHPVLMSLVNDPPTFSREDGSIETLKRTWRDWAQRHEHDLS